MQFRAGRDVGVCIQEEFCSRRPPAFRFEIQQPFQILRSTTLPALHPRCEGGAAAFMPPDQDRAVEQKLNFPSIPAFGPVFQILQRNLTFGYGPSDELSRWTERMRNHHKVKLRLVRAEPFANARLEGFVLAVGAQHESMETSAGPQVPGQSFDRALQDLLAIRAAIAENHFDLRSGNVGWMRDDPVEGQIPDRFVHVALEDGHVADVVHAAVEFGKPRGTAGDIDAPGMLRVPGGGERGDTTAGPDVQEGLAWRVRK